MKCPVCQGTMIYNVRHMLEQKMNIPFCDQCGYSNKLDWEQIEEEDHVRQDKN